MQFEDFLADQISFIEPTHIKPGSEFRDFKLTERPGRQRFHYFEDSQFENLLQFLAKEKKKSLVFLLPQHI